MNADIIERLKEVFEDAGLNISQASERIGIAQPNLSQMLNGKRAIGVNMIERLVSSFDISKDWLLTGSGNKYNVVEHTKTFVKDKLKGNLSEARIVTDLEFNLVPLIPIHAQAGYVRGYGDDVFIETLPRIPVITDRTFRGKYRVFEVSGDSMDDRTHEALMDKDYILGREVKKEYWTSKLHIRDWYFVIVNRNDGIVVKQITNHDVENGIITCHSLNPMYEDYEIKLTEVAELYNVIKVVDRSARL